MLSDLLICLLQKYSWDTGSVPDAELRDRDRDIKCSKDPATSELTVGK